jgi:DNA-binding LacI/PurR family transcriptional regulator
MTEQVRSTSGVAGPPGEAKAIEPTTQQSYFQACGAWLDDHWRPVLPVLGMGITAVFGVLMSSSIWYRWYWWVGLAAGLVVAFFGSVLGVRDATRASKLRSQIEQLKGEMYTARDHKRVFFVTSALTEDWQVSLEHNTLVHLWNRGFRPTVFAPLRNYSPNEQEGHFREIVERSQDYVGGLVIPIGPERRRAELHHFIEKFAKPIVFVDNPPFEHEYDYPARTRFVGFNSALGGQLAAKAVIARSSPGGIRRVLVIASDTQLARQQLFKEHLVMAQPDCAVVIDEGGCFSRDAAYDVVRRHLLKGLDTKEPFDVVFCTSDLMALGCLDAIRSIEDRSGFQKPRVFGYDGIEATLRLVKEGNSLLERVVVQDAHSLAVTAAEQLLRLLAGEDLRGSVWLEPTLYPSLERASSVPG